MDLQLFYFNDRNRKHLKLNHRARQIILNQQKKNISTFIFYISKKDLLLCSKNQQYSDY